MIVECTVPYHEGTVSIDVEQVAAIRRDGYPKQSAYIYMKGGQTIRVIDNGAVDYLERYFKP